MNQLKKLDIKAEIKKLKRSMDSDSETSESEQVAKQFYALTNETSSIT